MVDEDEFECDERGSAFLMGLLAGTVLAAGLGTLAAARDETATARRAAPVPAASSAGSPDTHLV